MYKHDADSVCQHLFEADNKEYSLFELAYLSAPSSDSFAPSNALPELPEWLLLPDYMRPDARMFAFVLLTVQGFLQEAHWQKISQKIHQLRFWPTKSHHKNPVILNEKYADQLLRIVDIVRARSNNGKAEKQEDSPPSYNEATKQRDSLPSYNEAIVQANSVSYQVVISNVSLKKDE